MKALCKRKAEKGLWMEDVPEPVLGPNDVLIRIKKTAICGTDLHIYRWDEWAQKTIAVPMVIGHEFVGEIVEVGSAVEGYRVGMRVSGEGHITCKRCRNCRAGRRHLCRNTDGVGVNVPGCFSELFRLPASNLFVIPDVISDEIASILDPLGNAVHTSIEFELIGEDVLITGAGPIGCMAAAISRFVGARHVVITDPNEYRLGLAAKLGATRAVNPLKENLADVMQTLKMTEGFDVGLEMSGNPEAFRGLLNTMNHGGRIALLGIFNGETAVDLQQVVFKGLNLKGIYGRRMFETWYKTASMLQSGLEVKDIITHRFSVNDFQEALSAMDAGNTGKVILDWESL